MNDHIRLFNKIATPYDLFFNRQKRHYLNILDRFGHRLDLNPDSRILDVGCGTGAFGAAISTWGCSVVGVDAAEKMVDRAQKRGVDCLTADVLTGLPFEDASFDLVAAAHVVHGLPPEERLQLYQETVRLTRGLVLFHDYNGKRSLGADLIEWLERGDYFRFIRTGRAEMENSFSSVEVFDVGGRNAWYLCRP